MTAARTLSLLSFAPLLLTLLARWWDEPECGAGFRSGRGAGGEPIPVLWGDPRRIYGYYVAAVLMAWPFVASVLHLISLSTTFQSQTSWSGRIGRINRVFQ